jgi:hypothetical protein
MYVVPFVLEEAIAAGLSIWSFCESQGKESPEPERVSTIEETSMKKCADQRCPPGRSWQNGLGCRQIRMYLDGVFSHSLGGRREKLGGQGGKVDCEFSKRFRF